jgi:DNA-binding transcriptional ArsR family regulator
MKKHDIMRCPAGSHPAQPERAQAVAPATVERAAAIFRALGDEPRLRLLVTLLHGECCVSELVAIAGEKFSTVSQRLRVLRSEKLVARRREQSHVYYSLADAHVADLVRNAVAHAAEPGRAS